MIESCRELLFPSMLHTYRRVRGDPSLVSKVRRMHLVRHSGGRPVAQQTLRPQFDKDLATWLTVDVPFIFVLTLDLLIGHMCHSGSILTSLLIKLHVRICFHGCRTLYVLVTNMATSQKIRYVSDERKYTCILVNNLSKQGELRFTQHCFYHL